MCSCNPDVDCKGNDEYCNWFSKIPMDPTRGKCAPKVHNGMPSNTAICGDGAVQCYSGYSCSGLCSCKKGDCTKDGEYCDQVYAGTLLTTAAGALSGNFKKEWFGKCRPDKEDGEPTFYAQVGCGDNNDYAEPCRSKWACGGYCSCNPADNPCDNEKYCDWQDEKKCVEKLDDGEATGEAQVGCGNNLDFARKCKSNWACGGYCSCNPDDNPCDSDKYCDWQDEKKCVEKLDNGEATGEAQVGCGNNNGFARKCKSNWACGGYCSCNPDQGASTGGCSDDEYCDWQGSKTCKEKLDNGESTNEAQIGCGNNSGYARKCKSNWACGGTCSCNPDDEDGCSDNEYCDWYTGGSRTCKEKLENGESTGSSQIGCGSSNDPLTYVKKCKSGHACYGVCSCSSCEDGKYCDWDNTRKCQEKLDNGDETKMAQVGCGNNSDFAKKCKSNWACGGKCSCNPDGENSSEGKCPENQYCQWWGDRKCKDKLTNGSYCGQDDFKCQSGICIDSYCSSKAKIGDPCGSADCAPNCDYHCEGKGKCNNWICVIEAASLNVGDYCSSNDKCKSNNCKSGVCAEPEKMGGSQFGDYCDNRLGEEYGNSCKNCSYGRRNDGFHDWCCRKEENCSTDNDYYYLKKVEVLMINAI